MFSAHVFYETLTDDVVFVSYVYQFFSSPLWFAIGIWCPPSRGGVRSGGVFKNIRHDKNIMGV